MGRRAKPFSLPLFSDLAARWSAWQKGITPNGQGYSRQNPRLLLAFDALDRAEAKSRPEPSQPTGPAESPQAFQQRIQREVMGR